MLHEKVPYFPQQHHEKQTMQRIKLRQGNNNQNNYGRNEELFFISRKEFGIAIGPHKPRKVVTHSKKGHDKK